MTAWILPQTRILQPSFPAEGAIAQYNLVPPALNDGEGVLLQVDATGALRVVLGAGGAVEVQGPAPQDDPVEGNPVEISFESQAYADTVAFLNPVDSDGDVVRPRASRYGVPYSMIVGDDGSMRLLYADDSAWGNGLGGAAVLARRNDGAATVFSTLDGNTSMFAVNDRGAVFTQVYVPSGGAAPFYAEDSAHASGDFGVQVLTRRADNLAASSAGDDGDYAGLNTDNEGYLYARGKAFDPAAQADRSYPVVDLASRRVTTPVQLLAANLTITSFSPTWTDVGPEIATDGYTRIGLWISITNNDATHIKVRCLAKHTVAGTAEYPLPILKADTSVAGAYAVYAEEESIEIYFSAVDQTRLMLLTWVLDNVVPYVQFQVTATDGGDDPIVIAADTKVTYAWGQ